MKQGRCAGHEQVCRRVFLGEVEGFTSKANHLRAPVQSKYMWAIENPCQGKTTAEDVLDLGRSERSKSGDEEATQVLFKTSEFAFQF